MSCDDGELLNCMRCGACMPTCPTFQMTGRERSSPRGRIALMRAVAEGQLTLDSPIFGEEMDSCVGCLACVSACPAGVRYDHLLERSRGDLAQKRRAEWPWWKRLAVDLLLSLFEDLRRLRLLATGLYFYQKSGLAWLVPKLGIVRRISPTLAELETSLPSIAAPGQLSSQQLPEQSPLGTGKRLGVLNGCVMDFMFAQENVATAQILQHLGHTVFSPKKQGCCGALHAHAGYLDRAKEMAKTNIAAYEQCELEFLVTNSSGCGNALKHYGEWLADDPAWAERAKRFSSRVLDLSQWLASDPAFEQRAKCQADCAKKAITYHDACHLAHGQGVRQQPRQLLQADPRYVYCELSDADRCCGSAGTYNIFQFENASKMLDEKIEAIGKTGAEIVVVANPGCLLQIRYGLLRAGLKVRAVHPAILWLERLQP